ncbi:heterokaryon incompatibility protein-domain-containing protein [Trametes polyzona]|nr:heterokaryon incompatibility protein-domain-containing protein [Trametes polyzona]
MGQYVSRVARLLPGLPTAAPTLFSLYKLMLSFRPALLRNGPTPPPSTNPPASPHEPTQPSSDSPLIDAGNCKKVPLPPRPPNICGTCWEGPLANQLGLLSRDDYSYLVSEYTLQRSTAEGCHWCRFVLDALDPSRTVIVQETEDPYKLPCEGEPKLVLRHWEHQSVFQMHFASFMEFKTSKSYVNVWTIRDDPAAKFIPHNDLLLDVGSRRTLGLAKECIHQCAHEHGRCRAITDHSVSHTLPTRLIDCADPLHPRLIHTTGIAKQDDKAYVALSYVWGAGNTRPAYCTTSANISVYTEGIGFNELPGTIRDAIRVTHDLGFRYLWVDGLCIIQDSKEDKHREIRYMRQIYRYASLTIVAASASGATEGFLQERSYAPPPTEILALPFICPQQPGNTTEASGYAEQPQVGTVYLHQRSTDRSDSPAPEHVDRRAWCFQELVMSPRSLIFTSQTVVFRCQTSTVNVGGAHHDGWFDTQRLPDELFESNHSTRADRYKIWRAWWKAVVDYSPRSVSFPSDKLVACGGVAEEFHRTFGSDYLAGLWRDSLLRDLLWRTLRSSAHLPRPRYRAPSWSWAAVEGGVELPDSIWSAKAEDAGAFAKVVNCSVGLEDDTIPFGAVDDGSLVMRAPLFCCAWGDVNGEDGSRIVSIATSQADLNSPKRGTIKSEKLYGRGWIDSESDSAVAPLRAALLLRTRQYHAKTGFHHGGMDREHHWWFLVLAPSSHNKPDNTEASNPGYEIGTTAFRRIGVFSVLQGAMRDMGWEDTLPPSVEIVII